MIRAVAANVLLKVASAALGLLASLAAARILGVEGYGTYAYVMALIALLAIPAGYGTPQWLLREVAHHGAGNKARVWRAVRWASARVGVAAAVVVAVSVAVAILFVDRRSDIYWPLLVALSLLPLNALTDIHVSVIHGLNRVILSQIPRLLLHPLVFLILLAVTANLGLETAGVLSLNAIASATALAIAFMLLRRLLLATQDGRVTADNGIREHNGTFSFMLITAVYLINNRADILMLGSITGPHAAGAYAAASRIVELVTFVLIGVNAVIAPLIGQAWSRGALAEIQQTLTFAARIATGGALIFAAALVAFRGAILSMFGKEFVAASTAMVILIGGQVLNAAHGSVALLLNMTGHERVTFIGVSVAAAVNVALNAFLIPRYDMVGAAIATAVSMVVWNLWLVVWVCRNLHLDSTLLGLSINGARNS